MTDSRSYADVVCADRALEIEKISEDWFVAMVVKVPLDMKFGFLSFDEERSKEQRESAIRLRQALKLHRSDLLPDLYFHFDCCAAAPIALRAGDFVRFQLDKFWDSNKPRVRRIEPLQYTMTVHFSKGKSKGHWKNDCKQNPTKSHGEHHDWRALTAFENMQKLILAGGPEGEWDHNYARSGSNACSCYTDVDTDGFTNGSPETGQSPSLGDDEDLPLRQAFFDARVSFWELCFREVFHPENRHKLSGVLLTLMRTRDDYMLQRDLDTSLNTSIASLLVESENSVGVKSQLRARAREPPLEIFVKEVCLWVHDSSAEDRGAGVRKLKNNLANNGKGFKGVSRESQLRPVSDRNVTALFASFFPITFALPPMMAAKRCKFDDREQSAISTGWSNNPKDSKDNVSLLCDFCRYVLDSISDADAATGVYRLLFVVSPLVRRLKLEIEKWQRTHPKVGEGMAAAATLAETFVCALDEHVSILSGRQLLQAVKWSSALGPAVGVESRANSQHSKVLSSVMERLFLEDLLARQLARSEEAAADNPIGDDADASTQSLGNLLARGGMLSSWFSGVEHENIAAARMMGNFNLMLAGVSDPSVSGAQGSGVAMLPITAAESCAQPLPGPGAFSLQRTVPVVHKMQTRFSTWQEYWETLFFLSRENCFGSLQHDVKLFAIKSPPEHDCRFYSVKAACYHTSMESENLQLFQVSVGAPHLLLKPHLLPESHSRLEHEDRWKKLALRYGSVLALAVRGHLDAGLLWLKVQWCDLERSGFVGCEMLELYSGTAGPGNADSGPERMNSSACGGGPQTNIVDKLCHVWGSLHQRSSWLLVESPTFFPAHGPVLRSLRERFRRSSDVGDCHRVIVSSDFSQNAADFCGQHHRQERPELEEREKSQAATARSASRSTKWEIQAKAEPFYLDGRFTVPADLVFRDAETDDADSRATPDANQRQLFQPKMLSAPITLKDLVSRIDRLLSCKNAEEQASKETIFNHEQLRAVQFALTHKVAIIQGAPGTGKSYMGVRLARILGWIRDATGQEAARNTNPAVKNLKGKGKRSAKAGADDPWSAATSSTHGGGMRILTLTYKNHALDEFLKDLLENNMFNAHEVIRVGGGSEEPLLKDRNWSTVKSGILRESKGLGRGRRAPGGGDAEERIRQAIDTLRATQHSLKEANEQRDAVLRQYFASGTFSPHTLLEPLSTGQLREFLVPCMARLEAEWGEVQAGNDYCLHLLDRHSPLRRDLIRILEYCHSKKCITLDQHVDGCFGDVETALARLDDHKPTEHRQQNSRSMTASDFLFGDADLGEASRSGRDLLVLSLAATWLWLPPEKVMDELTGLAADGSLNDQATRLAGECAFLATRCGKLSGSNNANDGTADALGGSDVDSDGGGLGGHRDSDAEIDAKDEAMELEDQEELEARQELEELAAGGGSSTYATMGQTKWQMDEDQRIRNGIQFFSEGSSKVHGKSSSVASDGILWPTVRKPILDSIRAETKELYRSFASSMLSTRSWPDRKSPSAPAQQQGGKAARRGARSRGSCNRGNGTDSTKAAAHGAGLWGFEARQRCFLVQVLIETRVSRVEGRLRGLEAQRDVLQRERCQAVHEALGSALRAHRVLGMTISGACIHADVVAAYRPHVVMVEEAAEVLEPQLLACLGPWVKHLIMIGDHWQLPPGVEWHELKFRHGLGRSLMERLIDGGLPHERLMLQSRMHPEISRHLKFKYTELVDNLPHAESKEKASIFGVTAKQLVAEVTAPVFTQKRFFWFDMVGGENKHRSVTNLREVLFCVKLALSLILSGIPGSQITILAPYLGQASHIKRAMRGQSSDISEAMWKDYQKLLDKVQVSSVDRFQGDENHFVIASMTRSNDEGNCGFLKTPEGLNRLIVLLSRARGGLYLVGDATCFAKQRGKQWRVWRDKIDEFRHQGCLGTEICLQCPRHEASSVQIRSDMDLDLKASCARPLCRTVCGAQLNRCGHECKQFCHSNDCNPDLCREIIPFHCPKRPYEHPLLERTCNQSESDIRCYEIVTFACQRPKCGFQELQKECWQEDDDIACVNPIEFKCSNCPKIHTRKCHEDTAPYVSACTNPIEFQCKSCKQPRLRPCNTREPSLPPCQHPCTRRLPGCDKEDHKCPRRCGAKCPGRCEALVDFECTPVAEPAIQHPLQRRCFQRESDVRCTAQLPFRCARAGHDIQRPCWQRPGDIVCDKPCIQFLRCGHLCPDLCGKPCPSERTGCKYKRRFSCWNCRSELDHFQCWERQPSAIAERCPGKMVQKCVNRGHEFTVACTDLPYWRELLTLVDAQEGSDPPDSEKSALVKAGNAAFLRAYRCKQPTEVKCSNCTRKLKEPKPCWKLTDHELCTEVCNKPLNCEFQHKCHEKCNAESVWDPSSNQHNCGRKLKPSPEDPNVLWCALCEQMGKFRAFCKKSFEAQRSGMKRRDFRVRASQLALKALKLVGKAKAGPGAAGFGRDDSSESGQTCTLLLGQLEYSQLAVSDTFKNGATVETVCEELKSGKSHVKDFPPLEVIIYRYPESKPEENDARGIYNVADASGSDINHNPKSAVMDTALCGLHLVSLDNRRLCTFRLALPLETRIPVKLWASPKAYQAATEFDAFYAKYDKRLERGADPVSIEIRPAKWEGDKKFAKRAETLPDKKWVPRAEVAAKPSQRPR